MNQARFRQQQRERARRQKAAEKFARRQERPSDEASAAAPLDATEEAAVLAELASLHARFEADEITFDDFELAKAELMERLRVN